MCGCASQPGGVYPKFNWPGEKQNAQYKSSESKNLQSSDFERNTYQPVCPCEN